MSTVVQLRSGGVGRVIIGMDPRKRSTTIALVDDREKVLAQGRYGTDTGGYQQLLAAGPRAIPVIDA